MKNFLVWAIMLGGIMLSSCTKGDNSNDEPGSIYGIVTVVGTAEPMKSVGVELYKKDPKSNENNGEAPIVIDGGYSYGYHSGVYGYALILKTVTFDDGHFEFKDLNPDYYLVKVVADGYEQVEEGYIAVEAGRQARIDLQVNKKITKPSVMTLPVSYGPSESVTFHGQIVSEGEPVYKERGFVISGDPRFIYDNDINFEGHMKESSYYRGLIWLPVPGRISDFSTDISRYYYGSGGVRAYAKYEGGTVYGSCVTF